MVLNEPELSPECFVMYLNDRLALIYWIMRICDLKNTGTSSIGAVVRVMDRLIK